ncbi:hypothetical protein CTI12_AA283330 [Artemisia annua]|uniref:Uncharacterized protein n=1 Tax=Artemisia annua TaxID=35608 RepID=A0A2U1NCA6_ARTAN|nr:hypothetical protein CTI12_AA283330 [Artemisia annua]
MEKDFEDMGERRLPRKPKKRPKVVQNQLDTLFPGLWLTEIHADLYRVSETKKNPFFQFIGANMADSDGPFSETNKIDSFIMGIWSNLWSTKVKQTTNDVNQHDMLGCGRYHLIFYSEFEVEFPKRENDVLDMVLPLLPK